MNTQKVKSKLSGIAVISAIGLLITAGGCSTSKQNYNTFNKDKIQETLADSIVYIMTNGGKVKFNMPNLNSDREIYVLEPGKISKSGDNGFLIDFGKITMDVIQYSGDTILVEQSKNLNRKEGIILRYLLSDSRNYSVITAAGNNTPVVAGRFMPNVRLKMRYNQKEVNLYFDLGLKQWSVCNQYHREINRYALVSNELHRFFCTLMPENNFLTKSFKLMYQQEEEEK
ncbi:MAG: hypothetical protein J6P44_01485 [Bacteroidales bacterium]|nr:hypothetical protein [Bacteroidales bacterium]